MERVAGTEPVSLAGVCTEAEELQVLAPDAPAGSQNEYQGQGQPAVPANAEHSELIFDHVSLVLCLSCMEPLSAACTEPLSVMTWPELITVSCLLPTFFADQNTKG